MNKQYYFLAGLPRTGNTVLSSILNQNPEVYSSPLSPVRQYMHLLESQSNNHEGLLRSEDYTGSHSILSKLLDNHYAHINKPIVFDRDKYWGDPDTLPLMKSYLTPNPKIVFTVRPLLEILTSFVLVLKNDFIQKEMFKHRWISNPRLSKEDNICDFLLNPEGDLMHSLQSLEELSKEENKGVFHLVNYNTLVSNPTEVMTGIYKFIDKQSFLHSFSDLKKIERDNEARVGMPNNMHEVRPTLTRTSPLPAEVLSDYVLTKYAGLNDWMEKQLC